MVCNVIRLVPREPVAFAVIENENGLSAKVFSGKKEDGPPKKRSAAQVTSGNVNTKFIHVLHELSAGLARMKSKHTLTFGVPERDGPVVTQKKLKSGKAPAGAIARDRKHWTFLSGRAGILMLDFDPRDGYPAKTWQQLDEIMARLVPGWKRVQRLWRPSSSAFINWPDGSPAIEVGGWRCYCVVDDASAIPMVVAKIYQEAWRLGYGHIQISKSGAILDRSVIDASVRSRSVWTSPLRPCSKTGLRAITTLLLTRFRKT